MKKQTKVLLAAALFTLGASFSSMAALKNGTWVLNEEGWQYADKDGDYVEGEWCVSYGTEYWINDEGVLGSSEWVTDDEHTYYVQSDGSKTISAWKYIFAEDDEDAEEESWFYFDAKGRMVKDTKKTIGDYTYYFDNEGKMLTGWVEYAKDSKDVYHASKADATTTVGNVFFTNEDGQLVKSSWLNEFDWRKNADDLYEGEDEKDFYAKSNGAIATGKTTVEGLTYFFNKTSGQMIDGWVVKVADGVNDDGEATYTYTAANAAFDASVVEAYWTNEIGYASKNGWEYVETPQEDDNNYWYYFDKLGRAFFATDSDAAEVYTTWEATSENGETNTITWDEEDEDGVLVNEKKINGVDYYFNEKGEMIDGLQWFGGDLIYLEDGAKATGKVTLTDENENDYEFYFAEKTEDNYEKYVAVNGNKGGYCYQNGQLMTSEESGLYKVISFYAGKKDNEDGTVTKTYNKFIVDYRGKIQHNDDKTYELENGGKIKVDAFNTKVEGRFEDSFTVKETEEAK